LRVPAPGQAKKVAMLGSLDHDSLPALIRKVYGMAGKSPITASDDDFCAKIFRPDLMRPCGRLSIDPLNVCAWRGPDVDAKGRLKGQNPIACLRR
jgi:hypothetical protein